MLQNCIDRLFKLISYSIKGRPVDNPYEQPNQGHLKRKPADDTQQTDHDSAAWSTVNPDNISSVTGDAQSTQLQTKVQKNQHHREKDSQSSFLNEALLNIPSRFRREYIIKSDISNGRENQRIIAISYKRNDEVPSDYHYVPEYVMMTMMPIDETLGSLNSCGCTGGCADCDCHCLSGQVSRSLYDSQGRLSRNYNVNTPTTIYECNAACLCDRRKCRNKVIQSGVRYKFALIRTKSRGWGIRSLEKLQRGSFIGVYSGELISASESRNRIDDTYLFNLSLKDHLNFSSQKDQDCSDQHNGQLEQDQGQFGPSETFVCDAKFYGNFTRFINHSCDPNVVGIRSFTKHHDKRFPYIAFFTNQDVPANTELTLNYGDNYWLVKCKRDKVYCLCRKSKCRFSRKAFPRRQKSQKLENNETKNGT